MTEEAVIKNNGETTTESNKDPTTKQEVEKDSQKNKDQRPKTVEEAKGLVAELKDLQNWIEFLIEDNNIAQREKNIEILAAEYRGEEPDPSIVEEIRELQDKRNKDKEEVEAIQRIIEAFAKQWEINIEEIVPNGPWKTSEETGEGVDLSYTELFNRLKAIEEP